MNLILSRTLFVLIRSRENKQTYLPTHPRHRRRPSMRGLL